MMPDEKLKESVQKLEPVLGPQAKVLWIKYLQARSPEKKESWRRRINLISEMMLNKYKEKALLPPKSETSGDYFLGLVLYPDRPYDFFGLREEELCRHILVVGMTGTGKTTAAIQLLKELKRHGKSFMVFDWQREYKKLRQDKQFKDLKVLRVGKDSSFRFNPLIPPKGTDTGEWAAKLVDVINHAYLGSYGTEFILRQAILKAYAQARKQGEDKYPTFAMVKENVKKGFFRGRIELWNQTAIRIVESLTYPAGLGPVLNFEEKTNIKELLKQDIIIELDALSQDDKKFLTEALLLWIYEFRKSQGETNEVRHAVVIEEAHNILSRKKERNEGGETIMETTLRSIRKFGEAAVIIDQEPGKISESIKANTTTKITFTLGNGKDIQDISQAMNLSLEQKDCLDQLKVGQALAKVKGRIDEPVKVRFPKLEEPSEEGNEGGGIP